ncbi:hypothetical protein [Nocardioides sp. SLBN-35]|uniref:hypothetical protein n=1 Tax=Nocardioides sp. SLBN-35 TaxID=2768445 RepID=UPI0011548C28|nr:hypothetical protein [Nocardioides sp. SLBN-35]TQK73027.1 hypothetical protein FBY23_4849 [Nocardioides sp. SLBN-35]
MKSLSARRAVAGISLGALAGLGLVCVPTAAHAAVETAGIGSYASMSGGGCPGDDYYNDEDFVPWSDNGVPVTKTSSMSGTFTGGEGDTVGAKTSTAATINSTPLGSGPATITGTSAATASVAPSGEQTACDVRAETMALARGAFTLTQPTWVSVTASGHGQRQGRSFGTSMVGIGNADEFGTSLESLFLFGGDALMVAAGDRGSATSSTLLQPGKYVVALGSLAHARTFTYVDEEIDPQRTAASASYSGDFRIEFSKPGTASPVTGKGASKVQFGERDCASGNIAVNLSKKTVKKAKRVAVRINGAKGPVLKGKKLKGKHPKAKTISVPTSITGTVKVKVKVMLANGRRVQATRSYLPCK